MSAAIVCGVDGSADSRVALRVAARLADRLQLRLVVAHVAESAYIPYTAAFGGVAGRHAVMDEIESREEKATRLVEEVVADAGLLAAEPRVVVGVAAEGLADVADEEDAELIVVGSRGRGVFRSAFLGSVSNALVGVARSPVLIVPPGATEVS